MSESRTDARTARLLADATGAPYQSCLQLTGSLRHTLKHTDLDTLVETLRDAPLTRELSGLRRRSPVRGKVIALAAPYYSAARTVRALNLAAFLGHQLRETGRSVCLLDLSARPEQLSEFLGTHAPNVLDLTEAAITPERLDAHLVRTPHNLAVLLGPPAWLTSSPGPEMYSPVLDACAARFDYVLAGVDVEYGRNSLLTEHVLRRSAHVSAEVGSSSTGVAEFRSWLTRLTTPRAQGGVGLRADQVSFSLRSSSDASDLTPEGARELLSSWRCSATFPATLAWDEGVAERELFALRGDPELDALLARVLHAATGDSVLAALPGVPPHHLRTER